MHCAAGQEFFMAEEMINTANGEEVKAEAATEEKAPFKTEREQQEDAVNKVIEMYGAGKLELAVPIKSRDKEINELEWDFTILTGKEYVQALDADRAAPNAFTLTNTQALAFFAAAAARKTAGLDTRDIRDRLGMQDAVKAIQIAQVFYAACNRAGNARITNK